jgi:protocatechuate 3,4-dioxygenase beta subunit
VAHYRRFYYQIAVLAGREGAGPGWHFLGLDAQKAEVRIALRPEQVVRGRLIDLGGQSAAGVRIEVVAVGKPAPRSELLGHSAGVEHAAVMGQAGVAASGAGDGSHLWEKEVRFWVAPEGLAPWPAPAVTDASGRFTLRGIGTGSAVTVRVRGNGQVASAEFHFPARPEARPPEVTFSGGEPYVIEGQVTDARTGRPVRRAPVQVDVSGAALFTGNWPVAADWKGRQGLVGQWCLPGSPPVMMVPAVSGLTDDEGRYRLSAFRNDEFLRQFSVTARGPEGQTYLTVRTTRNWPRGRTRLEVNLALPPGVRVQGRVTEAPSGKPVPGARIDFWSKTLKVTVGGMRGPDGVVYPAPRETDADGAFDLIVPPGKSYLLVNGPAPVYLLKKIALEEVGADGTQAFLGNALVPPLRRSGRPPHYYPDDLLALDVEAGAGPRRLTATLRRAPLLHVRVAGPDPRTEKVQLFHGQEPFDETSHDAGTLRAGEGRLPFVCRNPDAPLDLAVLDADHGVGGWAEFLAREGGEATLRLARCGSASARFVDAGGKPLANYRPMLWLSLPSGPYSSPQDLEERQAKFSLYASYDAVWAGAADPKHHGKGPRTDTEGRVVLPCLVPGATYRLALSGGKVRDFKVEPGKEMDLGDLTVAQPAHTAKLPGGKEGE